MIDKILLAPYYWTLRLRHKLYDCGAKKSYVSPVPTICVGNITVGGTGKTPHTEMLIRFLMESPEWKGRNIAVLSRGYKRKSKGFQIVDAEGSAKMYGDEPLQIKKKFPEITVAVDRNRVHGCQVLSGGTTAADGTKTPPADIIILDDAFQYRALRPALSIVLVDYRRPVFKDHLMPLGHLRDIPERLHKADMVIVTKCPAYMDEWEKSKWIKALGFDGKVLFSTIGYDEPVAVFPEGDVHYIHSQRLVLFTGIANDTPLAKHLSGKYKIVKRLRFGDHHKFSRSDIAAIDRAARQFPTALVATTEKDAQRLYDAKAMPGRLRERIFKIPIRAMFTSEEERIRFADSLSRLQQA
ncbi:MAG: tetraacyldisaccharide 4'-kinase [Bacteroidales bacterium]|nr:tetraacyldisaccharide 4'-kinase [Bacteroidales bacterium]